MIVGTDQTGTLEFALGRLVERSRSAEITEDGEFVASSVRIVVGKG